MADVDKAELKRQKAREHYQNNKQKYIDRAEQWRINNKEKVNKIRKKYRDKNTEYPLAYYEKNKEKINARNRTNQKLPHNVEKRRLRAKNKWLKQQFGITEDQYNEMSLKQNHLCAICFKPETSYDPTWKKVKKLAVDHCHETGKIRGLLCGRCNMSIGRFEDSIKILESAISYLKNNL